MVLEGGPSLSLLLMTTCKEPIRVESRKVLNRTIGLDGKWVYGRDKRPCKLLRTLSRPKVVAQILSDLETTGCIMSCPVAVVTTDIISWGRWGPSD